MPNQANNPCNRRNFDLAVAILRYTFPTTRFYIRDIYLDYGAGMMWETIVAETARNRDWGGYQILSPKQWDLLNSAESIAEITFGITALAEKQKELLE